jgi:hypothetical protein
MTVSHNDCLRRTLHPLSLASWLVLSLLSSGVVHAADVDAGSLQQRIERNQSLKLPRQMAPLLPANHQPRIPPDERIDRCFDARCDRQTHARAVI